MSDFLSSPFSPVLTDLAAGTSTGESASLTLDKKDSLESKLFRALSEKISCLQKTTFLLNQCIGEENQGKLQNDKELKILRKDFRKQMEKLSLLMSKKKKRKKKKRKKVETTKYQKHK